MQKRLVRCQLFLIWIVFFVCSFSSAQEIRWLRVTDLQSQINEIGAEFEGEFPIGNENFFSWPAEYGVGQNTTRMKGLWIGATNFHDPVLGNDLPVKVIASGPRDSEDRINHIFEQEIKLVGKYVHPSVVVDEQFATINDFYDDLDEIDPDIPSDRMIVVKFNTSMGVSVTKKVMVFAHPDHGNYFVNDYVFKNTGIYNRNGDVYQQDLEDAYFYFVYRYSMAGVTSTEFEVTWGAFESQWGENTINHNFGRNYPEYSDPGSIYYQLNGFYSFYGPNDKRSLTYAEDWGCPRIDDGLIGTAKYAGCVTLYADRNPGGQTNNFSQPSTTWFVSSDTDELQGLISTNVLMNNRYTLMSEGHPDQPHSAYVGDDYAINNEVRNDGGGTSQGQGFGPYDLAFGDSVRIVFAEGVNGLSWEECRRIGAIWEEHYSQGSGPDLLLPDGFSIAADHNAYKRAWVETGVDSILKTFNNAKLNFESGYTIAMPPPPPDKFEVTSGGNAITLRWSTSPSTNDNFDGFVIYRSQDNVLDEETRYVKIFETDASYDEINDNMYMYKDTSATRGPEYYYYIQTKSDGLDNDLEPGKPLYSSLFWTVTSVPAFLQRPPASYLNEVRVVPNPFDIRSSNLKGEDESTYNRIWFFGLPDACKLTILTERGDIIWEKEHDNGTGDEIWFSTTSSRQILVSGIYILHVKVTEDIYATEDRIADFDIYDDKLNLIYRTGDVMHEIGDLVYKRGDSTFRKFVVIR